MELWIPVTIAAAFFQNLRSALQKHLTARLRTAGATYIRFLFAIPFALLWLGLLVVLTGQAVPGPNATFAVYATVGGLAQILATFLLVSLFAHRNFVVGTTYSKTEPVQVAVFGILVLGDPLGLTAAVAILVSLAGVITISIARTELTAGRLLSSLAERPALIGIASGACFGISVVFYRGATLSLGEGDFLIRAATTLVFVTLLQTAVMTGWLWLREPGQLGRVLAARRVGIWVGLAGMIASACWFTAVTIQTAAYVRALGQIELVFTFLASIVFFREKVNRLEVGGVVLIVVGLLVLLLL
jgi:drug/metabolite transporter (DMT)-like permease